MSPAVAPRPAPVPPRVLIVDDAADDREMYALFLTTIGGCTVTQAASGREALHALSSDLPDVVVLDARLPDVDGAEVCRQFRTTMPENERTAVLAVTALPLQSPEVDQLIAAGTDSVLIKPCAPETLLKEIRQLAARGRTLRARGLARIDRATILRERSERLQPRSMAAHLAARSLPHQAETLSLTERVKVNYLDLPGLSLTVRQAQRMWGFDEEICERVLEGLSKEGFLIRDDDGQYRRRKD
jgi:two-component system OmpR family response regulator